MKTPSSELFELIHSLQQNEKRHFILFASMDRNSDEEKNYIRLFNCIASQETYDEIAAKNSTGIKNASAFKRIKNYTMETILRSQENFYANTSVEIQIARRLIQVEILYRKKQLGLVQKSLQKATKLALQHDKILDLAKCYEWESRIANATAKPKLGLRPEFLQHSRRIAQQCTRWLELRRLNNELWNIIHEADSITPFYKKKLQRIADETNKLLREGPAGLTIKKEALSILAVAWRFLDRWDKSYAVRKSFLELYESDPDMMNYNATEYIVAIGNVTNACREMGRYEEAAELYNKVRAFYHRIPTRHRNMRMEERYINLQNSYVSFLAKKKQYNEALKQGEFLIPELQKHKHTFQNSLEKILLETVTISAFYTRNFRKALQYYNKLTDREGKWAIPLLGLAIIYESGNRDLLHYRGRSYDYHLRKTGKKRNAALMNIFTSRLPQASGKSETRAAFTELKKVLETYPDETAAFGPLNWGEWIAGKV